MKGIEPRPVHPVDGRYNGCLLVNYMVESLVHYSYVLATYFSRLCVNFTRSNTEILRLRVNINGIIAELMMVIRRNSRTCSNSLTESSEFVVNHTRFVLHLEIREAKQL